MNRYFSKGFLIGMPILGIALGTAAYLMQLRELPFMILCVASAAAYAWLYPVRSK